MGPLEQNIAKQAIRANRPIPNRILNAPELNLGLNLYLDAFFDLDLERTHNSGVTPIPFLSIVGYAQAFEFSEEQTQDLIYFIKELDREHLKTVAAEIKNKLKSKQNG